MRHAFSQDLLHAQDFWISYFFRIEYLVDSPLVRLFPAFDPVGQIKAAIRPEIHVGGQHRPDELVLIDHLEGSALRLDGQGADAALPAAAAKITKEEVSLVAFRQ